MNRHSTRHPARPGFPRLTGWLAPWLRRLLAIALVLLMQGPAMVLQEIAWARMLVEYTQERGWKRGVTETFDGDHPCQLCLKARKIHEDEKRGDPRELPGSSRLARLAWAEMLPGKPVSLPPERTMTLLESAGLCTTLPRDHGRDAPVPPPPERA